MQEHTLTHTYIYSYTDTQTQRETCTCTDRHRHRHRDTPSKMCEFEHHARRGVVVWGRPKRTTTLSPETKGSHISDKPQQCGDGIRLRDAIGGHGGQCVFVLFPWKVPFLERFFFAVTVLLSIANTHHCKIPCVILVMVDAVSGGLSALSSSGVRVFVDPCECLHMCMHTWVCLGGCVWVPKGGMKREAGRERALWTASGSKAKGGE